MAKKAAKVKDETAVDMGSVKKAEDVQYFNLLKAHRQTGLAMVIHGSSGYGKTYIVNQYARKEGMQVLTLRGSYLDAQALFIPNKKGDGTFEEITVDWLDTVLNTDVPTVVFLDEVNRTDDKGVFAMFMELMNERTVHKRPISNTIQIVAAANLLSEDVGVNEMPSAFWERATHITHAPSKEQIIQYAPNDMMREMYMKFPEIIPEANADVHYNLKGNPRQQESLIKLLTQKEVPLNDTEKRLCAIGRLGEKYGLPFLTVFEAFTRETKRTLPATLKSDKDFFPVWKVEKQGHIEEVYHYLLAQKDKELVAEYLTFFGSKELCRLFFDNKSWDVTFKIKKGSYGPTFRGLNIFDIFFRDMSDEVTLFEGTEYGNPLRVNGYKLPVLVKVGSDYKGWAPTPSAYVPVNMDLSDCSFRAVVQLIQKVINYDAHVPDEYKDKLTRNKPENRFKHHEPMAHFRPLEEGAYDTVVTAEEKEAAGV